MVLFNYIQHEITQLIHFEHIDSLHLACQQWESNSPHNSLVMHTRWETQYINCQTTTKIHSTFLSSNPMHALINSNKHSARNGCTSHAYGYSYSVGEIERALTTSTCVCLSCTIALMSEDSVIKKRLVIEGDSGQDDKRLGGLLKTFLKWCAADSLSPEENEATYQKIIFTLTQVRCDQLSSVLHLQKRVRKWEWL